MSAATKAVAKLAASCAGSANVERAFEAFQRVTDRMAFGDDDIVRRMQDAAALILVAEDLETQAKMLAATARDGLAEVMTDVGAPNLKLPHHTIVAGMKSPTVIITDETQIPASLMTTPEPRPNLNAIRQFLSHGERVPGAELSNAGQPVLSIRSTKK